MTREEINRAIAEACGYKNIRYDWINGSDAIKDWLHDEGRGIPNYYHDLNAMHEAEKVLTEDQHGQYISALIDIRQDLVVFAASPQRAEAFLRTIGKWTE